MTVYKNNASDGQIIYNWNLNPDFPPLKPDEVDRSYLIDTIADILTEDNPIVYIEGEEGSGSTTILAQFCQAYPQNSFTLFIKPVSKFSYSLDFLRFKLFTQYYWFLEGITYDQDAVDYSLYETYLQKLRRSKKERIFYFVIDGLHQIPQEDQSSIEQIIKEVLPIGAGNNFRFLITGKQAFFCRYTKRVLSKPYQLAKFSKDETEKYFSDIALTPVEISEVMKVCKGIPGRLASVKRLLNATTSLEQILDSEPSKHLDFIQLEFEILDTLDEAKKTIIAVIAFGKRTLTESELIGVTHASPSDLDFIKSQCLFLSFDSSTGLLEFISESHRKFAERKLSHLQKTAFELQITYLSINPSSLTALRFLPSYYQSLNQQQAIVDLVSTDHYTMLLESTQSITALKNRAELAYKSAISLKQVVNVFKFSLHKSFFTAITTREGLESEISALVTLNQPEMALTLANTAASKEDRLALLATYAKKIKQKNGILEPELVTHIKQLTEEIDFAECGEKSIDIATDILFIDPDLAITIIEKARKESTQTPSRDAALAHLSITASINNFGSSNSISMENKALNKISDEALQRMTSTVAVLFAKYSVSELKKTVEQMKSTHRLFFLQAYISRHLKNPEILDVVEYALDFLISDTLYIPKSRDLAELVRPLPFALTNVDRLKKLILRFDSQLGLIQNLAISKDLVIFQMSLARAQITFDVEGALQRIEQVYYDVTEIKNLETLIECYALLINALMQIDSKYEVENKHHYIQIVQGDLRTTIQEVLKQTADHYAVVKSILDVLAASEPSAAIELASNLNTLERRDTAFRHITRILASKQFSEERGQATLQALNSIQNPKKKIQALHNIINVLELNQDKSNWVDLVSSLKTIISEPKSKLNFDIKFFDLLIDTGRNPSLEDFITNFKETAKLIDSKIALVDLYFRAVPPIGKIDSIQSLMFYELGNAIKKELKFNSDSTSIIFQNCLSLLFRTLNPIFKFESNWEDFVTRIDRLIQMLPSPISQAYYYNELAVRAWCVGKTDICKYIVKKYCQPLLDAYKTSNEEVGKELKKKLFSSFHCNHPDTAFMLLDDLFFEDKNDVLSETAAIRLRKLPTDTPYHQFESDTFKLSKEDAYDIVKLIEHMDADANIYSAIETLISSMTDKLNKSMFTIQQKTDIGNKLLAIVESKLPDLRNIKHLGYKISGLAKIYELIDAPRANWDNLLAEVETITNIADRGYVYVHIAVAMPGKYSPDKKRLLDNALKLFYNIPSATDKLGRLETFSRSASTLAITQVKDALKKALLLTLELEDKHDAMDHQKEIITIADTLDNKFDSGFADELIELIDDDPARDFAKRGVKYSAAQIKCKRDVANAKDVHDASNINQEFLTESAWKNLAALLANKLETKNDDVMNEYVSSASNLGIEEAYPILAWYIENASRRFIHLNDFNEKVLPIAEVLLLTTEMAGTIIANSNNVTVKFNEVNPQSDGPILVAKTREEAIDYLRNWLRKNSLDYVTYCDPYFGPDDVDFFRLVVSECPTCKVSVLTSKKNLQKINALSAEAFLSAWHNSIEQDPPETEIIAIDSMGTNERAGIHDRWILTKGAGLRLGTSYNSLGMDKLSEISELIPSKVEICEAELSKYLNKERFISGNKVNYTTFNL